ncbi:tRNA (N6-isopentenyl adenosine(37)-C2)-methylthiotransferase MiaB [Anaerofustis stercorihominis]|uniref:tRNA-2-methylthio-N(6)-dimethylallyladenosine synthase n=1 Tax=Anaerofustis stercorihominis DSM 17244 TaxID=445971 RepID=B1C6T3_9FIRM|nr:tRNA (N6-isopentenyl adenosine(37)-C2)-methylthiotransferase MiaB [Anaerofustis stercorihominis]EDS72720.1 tRNA-i(6)A37 thiotransferase enzyme MiaB [Anaerofustis stercorihominis DSM 17244]MCQ4794094.1 tRNA (N6-isopentenyl adenosine(37)-C2)-methylthiotransferase MiaB [Anaerofustis stercorihominis]
MKKYLIITYGCQMNENDSEKISGMVEELGYSRTEDEKDADLIIMNTCSVRENANNRFFGNLGNFKKLKKKKPDLILAVCGCMMQEGHIVKKIKEKYSFVDIVFGTHNISSLPSLLEECDAKRKLIVEVLEDSDKLAEGLPVHRQFKHKAFVSIMKGCNNFCSYCIVPYTRGRERSREYQNILSEVRELANDGVKEVTLLGQNVNSYGKNLDDPVPFAKLLKMVSEVEGIERVRFMTSHPKDLSDELIEVIRDNPKICRHIHLPMQSGSSRILKLMNRHYDKDTYIKLVKKIRREIPDVAITTDIIVGFPTETEEDFLDTLDVYKKCEFDTAFTFIYSKREGTKAAVMDGQIDEKTVKDRFDRLLKLHDEIVLKQNKKYLNREVDILIDGKSKTNDNVLTGRTSSFKLVNFTGKGETGDIVKVKITDVHTFHLSGEVIE